MCAVRLPKHGAPASNKLTLASLQLSRVLHEFSQHKVKVPWLGVGRAGITFAGMKNGPFLISKA
jgi:hypothetical protein